MSATQTAPRINPGFDPDKYECGVSHGHMYPDVIVYPRWSNTAEQNVTLIREQMLDAGLPGGVVDDFTRDIRDHRYVVTSATPGVVAEKYVTVHAVS